MSLVFLKMSEGRLTVVGAAMVMLLHAGNVTMLLVFRPYKSKKVTNTETTMLACLFMVLWCAVIKDLVSNHVNAQLFEETLQKVNMGIDVMAVVLMLAIIGIPLYQLADIGQDLIQSFRSADTLLNDIHMTQVQKAELAEKEAVSRHKVQESEDAGAESSMLMPIHMEHRFPALAKALEKLSMSSVQAKPEQRRKFRQFVQLGRNFKEVDVSKVAEHAHTMLAGVQMVETSMQKDKGGGGGDPELEDVGESSPLMTGGWTGRASNVRT